MPVGLPFFHFYFSVGDDTDAVWTNNLPKSIVIEDEVGVYSDICGKYACRFFCFEKFLMNGVEIVIIVELFSLIIIFIELSIERLFLLYPQHEGVLN